MGNVLVLCSGGFESTVLVHLARSRGVFGGGVHFIHPQSGQGYRRSRVIALRQRLHNCGALKTILDRDLNLEATQEAPLPRGALPVMIFNAVNLAHGLGCGRIWLGGSRKDQRERVELSSDYIDAIAKVAAFVGVKVVAPFLKSNSEHIKEVARGLGVPLPQGPRYQNGAPDGRG